MSIFTDYGDDKTIGGRGGEEPTASERLAAARERDLVAHARDITAQARDLAAAARDEAMQRNDALYEHDGDRSLTPEELVRRAATDRRRAATYRAEAAEHRARAAADRRAAAEDRAAAARDRLLAAADREILARALNLAETDPITGARVRSAGLVDVGRELDRARRKQLQLVVAYVDVVGLKQINDTRGHGAGDALLREVVQVIRINIRPHDLVVRLGGDEFLCVMADMTLDDACGRFRSIAAQLRRSRTGAEIRTGLVKAYVGETVEQVVARADAELMRAAQHR